MKRRAFLQASGLLGFGATFNAFGLNNPASFYTRFKTHIEDLGVQFTPLTKDKAPQIIYVFLYGGPSELAGNLSNIEDINLNSQNPYPATFLPDNANTIVTPNYFWRGAGGELMEDLIKSGDMSVYRTLNRIVDDSKGHGSSVAQNLTGNLDISLPGIGTNLAQIIAANNPFAADKPLEELVFPFVSFEGETQIFNLGTSDIPLALRPISLNSNLQNPYSRRNNDVLPNGSMNEGLVEDLARAQAGKFGRFPKITEAFNKRGELSDKIGSLLGPDAISASIDTYNASLAEGDPLIDYPNNNFGNRMKAAVSLALANPETMFINMGSGGLGGWDDHSEALVDYPTRMSSLMTAVKAAVRHIELASDPDGPAHRANANNIIIKIHGEFGRNVNLNNSKGWDHGNNQNLYTIGGKNIRSADALGKIIGTTKRIGKTQENRQFTSPADDSYQFEPYALAASLYKYFGVTNPDVLTQSVDKSGKAIKFSPIDEAQEGVTLQPWEG